MIISKAKKQKIKEAFDESKHPRNAAGTSGGGKFAKKQASPQSKPVGEFNELSGNDFKQHFQKWRETKGKLEQYVNTKKDIRSHENKLELLQSEHSPSNKDKIEDLKSAINVKSKALKNISPSEPRGTVDQMKSSMAILDGLHYDLNNESRDVFVGLKHKDSDRMNAALSYSDEDDHVYVNYLMTDPESLFGAKGVGAGTEAIKYAAKRSMDTGKAGKLKLSSTISAIPFYEKLGFKRNSIGDHNMTLSPESAKKLLESG